MDPSVQNLLYRRPDLYELVYPEPGDQTPRMCRRMFAQFLSDAPKSILDIGCGTGRDLASLVRDGAEGVGVDFLPDMIDFAKGRHANLQLHVADMHALRLNRRFDAILSMGSAPMYALTNADVDRAFATFEAHSHPGTLLVLDINNASGYLGGGCFTPAFERRIEAPGFSGRFRAEHSFDLRRQVMVRRRTWDIPGQPPVQDFCQYRLFFPAELEYLLSQHGFRAAGMFDNMELLETDLSGPRLYVAALATS